ncbi:MAG TPA: hypothetical protein VK524_10765 [Polyangiaceae bacterium]|nr:hypothetical protein [Polyangiaceae bacterium]
MIRTNVDFLSVLVALLAAVGAPGCSSDDSDNGDSPALNGHSIRLSVQLQPDGDGETLTFLTPALSTFSMTRAGVIGRPYYVATFTGGFDQGVDLDLHHEWGTVPEDLHVQYVSPAKFENGPYDVAFIVYTQTEITDAIRKDYFTVVPRSGELSAFTLSQDRVKPGDPKFSNGVVRVNVEDADAELALDNKHDTSNIGGSLVDTVLTVP